MKKYLVFIVLFSIGFSKSGSAKHLKGGWIQYEYISTNTATQTNKYKITVHQYMLCSSNQGQWDDSVYLGIFDGVTNIFYRQINIKLTSTNFPSITTFNPCITPIPKAGDVCYRIDDYETTIDLPFNNAGYILEVQRCCRINGIVNLTQPSNNFGITYYNKIPGKISGIDYSNNSSPIFQPKDTVIICHSTPFAFDFSATDKDADSLAYIFCDGLTGGFNDPNGSSASARPLPPNNPPPYQAIAYATGFSGSSPMGMPVTINPRTGIISGVAPDATGDYVIAVCALEYRNGILIGSNKKEIHINVAACELSSAKLNPSYISCDGYTLSFENLSQATTITYYLWDFGVPNLTTDTSTSPTPTYPYPQDTGVYILKLFVKSKACADSTTALVKIFPGFTANFTVSGYCYQNPFYFTNTTIAKYGFVDSVYWDFGETSLSNDTSTLNNPNYKYLTPGDRNVLLYAHSSKGCSDTIPKVVNVLDKPIINLPFKDTLICSIDTLQLHSSSSASIFSWSPNLFISNTNIANPYVFPKDTTLYILTVTDNGCINRDTIKVNVLDFITVDAGPDANLCLTDNYKMQTKSYATSYLWTPSLTLNDSTLKYPLAMPTKPSTTYYVKANLGKCQDRDSVTLFTFPYPIAKASPDTSICFGQTVKIFGIDTADIFYWSPGNSLSDSNLLSPIAKPNFTTDYILTAQYLTGCLKQVKDTVHVNVVQPFTVFAGRDTSVVFGQPLQLFALVDFPENKFFTWTSIPNAAIQYLNFTNIQTPVATFPIYADSVEYFVRAYTKEQCDDTASIKIKIFKTVPSLFVPDVFTPNGDGLNEVIRPIPVGITKLNYFNIYNRWGQLIFTTTQIGKGWDGNFNGIPQASGTFVYTVQGQDYLGKTITQKGTVVLIR